MKHKKILKTLTTFAVCTTLLCSSVFAEVTDSVFPDVPANSSYKNAVETLHALGIINGDDQGNFNPDNTITRAEAATIICKMMGVADDAQTVKSTPFTDVPVEHWAAKYISKAAELGIISGYGGGKFGPSDPVTYEQMIKMLVSAWGYDEWAQAQGGYPTGYLYVAETLDISTSISFNGSSSALRRDVAVLCYNMLSVAGTSES